MSGQDPKKIRRVGGGYFGKKRTKIFTFFPEFFVIVSPIQMYMGDTKVLSSLRRRVRRHLILSVYLIKFDLGSWKTLKGQIKVIEFSLKFI